MRLRKFWEIFSCVLYKHSSLRTTSLTHLWYPFSTLNMWPQEYSWVYHCLSTEPPRSYVEDREVMSAIRYVSNIFLKSWNQRGQINMAFTCKRGFLGGSSVKNPRASVGDPGSIPGLGRSSGGGNGNSLQYSFFFFFTPVFLPGKSHGQRSLVGYSHSRTPLRD